MRYPGLLQGILEDLRETWEISIGPEAPMTFTYVDLDICNAPSVNSICHGTGHTGLGLTYVGSGTSPTRNRSCVASSWRRKTRLIVFVELENCFIPDNSHVGRCRRNSKLCSNPSGSRCARTLASARLCPLMVRNRETGAE